MALWSPYGALMEPLWNSMESFRALKRPRASYNLLKGLYRSPHKDLIKSKDMAVYKYPRYETGQGWTLEPGNLEGGFWGDQ